MEGDRAKARAGGSGEPNFNPLPPCGGRHVIVNSNCKRCNFNPLPPCGGRPAGYPRSSGGYAFQSTPSVWRETNAPFAQHVPIAISIHSLRVEGDCSALESVRCALHFNPLPPCGGKHTAVTSKCWTALISIHSLRVEGDSAGIKGVGAALHFNPLPPCGGRLGHPM